MIAALVQCVITLAIFLVVASLPFGVAGRPLRQTAFRLFLGVFGLALVLHILGTLLPIVLSDWRFYACWVVVSPVAYLILETRKRAARSDAAKEQQPNPPKRRDRDVADHRPDDSEEMAS